MKGFHSYYFLVSFFIFFLSNSILQSSANSIPHSGAKCEDPVRYDPPASVARDSLSVAIYEFYEKADHWVRIGLTALDEWWVSLSRRSQGFVSTDLKEEADVNEGTGQVDLQSPSPSLLRKRDETTEGEALAAVESYGGVCYIARSELEESPSHMVNPLPGDVLSPLEIPRVFDWRNVDGINYVTKDLQEHLPTYCGSCWAHAAISSISDRFKIQRMAAWPDITLSVQELINCGGKLTGDCHGGKDLGAYAYMARNGVVDDTCQVYRAVNLPCYDLYKCASCWGHPEAPKCSPVLEYDLYFVDEYGEVPKYSVHHMEAEIFKRGPISCGVDDHYLLGFTGKSVVKGEGKKINHLISVVGWGETEEGEKYWIVRNSWGTSWGDKGWVRIAKGVNALSIETNCAFATPKWPPERISITKPLHGLNPSNTIPVDAEQLTDLIPDREKDGLNASGIRKRIEEEMKGGESDRPRGEWDSM